MNNSVTDGVDKVVAQWASEKPQLETMPMAIIGRMMRLYKHLEAEITACHKGFGLTQGEFDVLATLRRSGAPFSLTPSTLLDSMMLTSGAMTNRLDKLEQKGLISRAHSQQDRRSVTVALTDAGLSLIDIAIEAHVAVQQQSMQGLSSQERAALNDIFKQWLTQFEP